MKGTLEILRHMGICALMALLLLPAAGIGAWRAPVYALEGIDIRQEASTVNAQQGESGVQFAMILKNNTSATFENVSAEVDNPSGFSNGALYTPTNSTLEPGATEIYIFKIDIGEAAGSGNRSVPIRFYYNNGGDKAELTSGSANINVSRTVGSPTGGFNVPLLDVALILEKEKGLEAGATSVLSLTVTNRGNLLLQDVQVSLALPESMSIDNAAASQHIGYMGVGETKTVKFPVFVNKKTENKNYQIAAKMTALNKGAPASFERTFYVPVFGGEEEKEIKASDISVTGIILPAEVKAGEEFTMDFRIENNGESKLEDVKIDVAPEAGVVNKTKNVFVEPVLEPGASKAYSVTFFSDEKAEQKSYPIKITVTAGTGEKPAAVSQYGSVFLRKTDAVSNIKTPKLIVDNYNYGGGSIRAGDSFGLSLSLYNTSEKNIRNIKVTVTAETGAIVPSGGSNAFFIDNIPSKDRVSKNLTMAASPTAEQKTTSLTVTMAYEDGSGNEFTSADVIAIPVIQKTSLTVDDVMSNGSGIYVGTQTSLSVRFYNTGKTQLRNLRILAEGNFEPVDVASYYAGNMESGASDSYEFAFVPTEEGALEGSVIFTFEDPSGNGQRQEQGFSFPVSEQMEEPDMGLDMPIQPESPFGGKLPYIIGGAAVAVILAALLLRRFLKRWKLDREMEIDE